MECFLSKCHDKQNGFASLDEFYNYYLAALKERDWKYIKYEDIFEASKDMLFIGLPDFDAQTQKIKTLTSSTMKDVKFTYSGFFGNADIIANSAIGLPHFCNDYEYDGNAANALKDTDNLVFDCVNPNAENKYFYFVSKDNKRLMPFGYITFEYIKKQIKNNLDVLLCYSFFTAILNHNKKPEDEVVDPIKIILVNDAAFGNRPAICNVSQKMHKGTGGSDATVAYFHNILSNHYNKLVNKNTMYFGSFKEGYGMKAENEVIKPELDFLTKVHNSNKDLETYLKTISKVEYCEGVVSNIDEDESRYKAKATVEKGVNKKVNDLNKTPQFRANNLQNNSKTEEEVKYSKDESKLPQTQSGGVNDVKNETNPIITENTNDKKQDTKIDFATESNRTFSFRDLFTCYGSDKNVVKDSDTGFTK